jgi:hypothetical protein
MSTLKILKLNFFIFFIKARVKNKRFRRTEFRLKEKTFRQSTPNGLSEKGIRVSRYLFFSLKMLIQSLK